MATLFELKDEILKGRRVKRFAWGYFYRLDNGFPDSKDCTTVFGGDLFADDWTLEPLPKKKIKLYAYTGEGAGTCRGAQVWFIKFNPEKIEGCIRLPNLDQEIEVDE